MRKEMHLISKNDIYNLTQALKKSTFTNSIALPESRAKRVNRRLDKLNGRITFQACRLIIAGKIRVNGLKFIESNGLIFVQNSSSMLPIFSLIALCNAEFNLSPSDCEKFNMLFKSSCTIKTGLPSLSFPPR